MNDYSIFFGSDTVDTPSGMSPAATLNDAPGGVPMSGSGLDGYVYHSESNIWSTDRLREAIAEADEPDLIFTATDISYVGTSAGGRTVQEFLQNDAASLSGDGSGIPMDDTGLVLSGYIYIPAGTHEIEVRSDDGFELQIGGVDFSEFTGGRGTDSTYRVAEFEGGLYSIDMIYFDGGGGQALDLRIDGLTVQPSALFNSVDEFTNPPAGTTVVPVEDYHPSHFLGLDALDGKDTMTGGSGVDIMDGLGGNDILRGRDGNDELTGGYGDDRLIGGAGDDVLDGGRGSDWLRGGDGDDILIGRSDAGEQRIGQLAIGRPTRDDPDGEVNDARQKLAGYEGQALVADDIMEGGAGRDTFLITAQINAKLEIIEKHVRSDGTINWAGVAGENDELHDHWVDSFGIDIIADYNADEDTIAVIGHTAMIGNVMYRDINGDGTDESIVTVVSMQHGNGGAHDRDLIGQLIVYGDRVEADDIITDDNVTYGIVETIDEIEEGLLPMGDVKVTGNGVYGYDTRDANGNMGAVTGSPEDHVDNPWLDQMNIGAPSEDGPLATRGHFDQLGEVEAEGQTIDGTTGDDVISTVQTAEGRGMPGALAFWSFDDADGTFEDARGGPSATAHTLYESAARARLDGVSDDGPRPGVSALTFNGTDEFAHIQNDAAFQVSQGTIAIWVRPDEIDDKSIFLSKDESGNGDGGHFRLGHTDDGGLILRMAPGDGRGSNVSWETDAGILEQGQWSHIAVNYTADGVTVFVDGQALPDNVWNATEGAVANPGIYSEAYMTMNAQAWVLGADSAHSNANDTAGEYAADDRTLDEPFQGALAEFGIWGGNSADDALTRAQINRLIEEGPGNALTNTSGDQPMMAADDVINGGRGGDTIEAGAGDDRVGGQGGADDIDGGYGNDFINGGAGNDTLNGGRGSDILIGGDGDDLLISRADVGEQRIGQLVIGEPSRPGEEGSVNYDYLKLQDWVDQPVIGDDILIGGAGRDHFYFETTINAKLDIIMDHVMDNRMIHWHGVAGENTYLHDHWVDSLGIEIIGDYNAEEDTISVVGHTTNVNVTYESIDSDGDGLEDSMVSIIEVYSQQGAGGGAHDEDNLGYIVVHGDRVDEEDIITDAGAHYGIVDTIDELQEALAPDGDARYTDLNGEQFLGYDTRDIEGNPIGSDPETYSLNPFLNDAQVDFADNAVYDGEELNVIATHNGREYQGGGYNTLEHDVSMQLQTGSVAFSFNADQVGNDQRRALISKDHVGYETGGHLSIWIDEIGRLKVRFQSGSESRYLYFRGEDNEGVVAGEDYNVAFTFDEDQIALYVNGELADTDEGFDDGMLGNYEDMLIGASSQMRRDDADNAQDFFDGTISNVTIFDRALTDLEALLLDEFGGNVDTLIDAAGDPQIVVVDGTTGDDTVMGNNASEQINGMMGNDMIDGGAGDDIIRGGMGNDELTGGAGNDLMSGQRGGDIMEGNGGDDRLRGGGGSDEIDGGLGDDFMAGGTGNDSLTGGDGNDVINGNAGNDFIAGGAGRDMIRTGEGADTVLFAHYGGGDGDVVRNFVSGEDMLAFDETVFDLGDLAASFTIGDAAADADDRLIYNQTTGRLYYDADGSGDGEMYRVASFGADTVLTVDDLSVV